jgi:hypothetical protein
MDDSLKFYIGKPPSNVSLGSSGFECQIEENLKWRKFNTETALEIIEIMC